MAIITWRGNDGGLSLSPDVDRRRESGREDARMGSRCDSVRLWAGRTHAALEGLCREEDAGMISGCERGDSVRAGAARVPLAVMGAFRGCGKVAPSCPLPCSQALLRSFPLDAISPTLICQNCRPGQASNALRVVHTVGDDGVVPPCACPRCRPHRQGVSIAGEGPRAARIGGAGTCARRRAGLR